MRTILFSGVHGVGKGFFLDKVKENIRYYNVYSASNLIEKYQPSTDAGYKKVSNVKNNQDVLIRAIKEAKVNDKNDFILDGHLCIFNAEGKVEHIPEYFFAEAQINGIILLQDEAQIVCDRINQRDFNKISVNDIKCMQEEEQKYADELKDKLQIEYKIITHECTGKKFEELLNSMGGGFIE